jgi:xanthine/uracil permease
MNKFLHDNQGNESMMRLMMAWAFIVIFSVWAVICLVKMELFDIPIGIGSIIGVILAAKYGQGKTENEAAMINKEPCAPNTIAPPAQ